LKIDKIKEDIALERHFQPLVEPLKQIVVENCTAGKESQPIKKKVKNVANDKNIKERKPKDNEDNKDNNDDGF